MCVFILCFVVIVWSAIDAPRSKIMVSENEENWNVLIKDTYIKYKNEVHGHYKYLIDEDVLVISSLVGKRSKSEPDSLILI